METAKVYNFKQDIAGVARDYMDRNNTSMEEFAKRIHFSRPALTQYLSGKYASNPANIEKAIMDYLKSEGVVDSQGEKTIKASAPRPDFFPTRDAKNIIAVCQSCQEFKGLGMVVGKSGFGKTFALKQFSKGERVCYIECNDTMGGRDLVKAMEMKLGLPKGQGSISDRLDNIKEFFSVNTGYLLIVDEADKLISKDTQRKLEILRALFDNGTVAVLIAGEPKLESLIKLYLPRFANRVDFYLNLKGLSDSEVEKYLEGFSGYGFAADAIKEMVTRATNHQIGCFRLLDRTLKNVMRLQPDPDGGITLDIISKASSMMML